MKINNDKDLKKALKRLDEIWDARPGCELWEERRNLVDQIVKYEDETVHIPPPSVEAAILFRLEQEKGKE